MRFPVAALLFGLTSALSSGQVFLKPNGADATPLREKSLIVHTVLDRGLASTRMTMVFANQTASRIEADFIYTLQPGMQATSFAYWYGREKVPAIIVERERAAEIYMHITTRQHDPALIEVIGKRTFRARIFPVMPNSDLKVEVEMVQPLSRGKAYELPIQLPKGQTLDSMDLEVDNRDSDQTELLSSYPLQAINGSLRYHAESLRPDHAFRLTYRYPSTKLRAHLFAAPSGGPDGFFVLNVTGESFDPVSIKATGILVSNVYPRRLPKIGPNHEAVIVGRYRGSGNHEVVLTDRAGHRLSLGSLKFSGISEQNHPATKLWAAAAIGSLSVKTQRNAMIALSERFGIPSPATSWLAIPQEERVRYAREKAEADVELLVRKYVLAVAEGQSTQDLVDRIDDLSSKSGIYWQNIKYQEIWQIARVYANELGIEIVAGRDAGRVAKHDLLRLNRLGKEGNYSNLVRDCLREASEVDRVADQIIEDISLDRTGPNVVARKARLRKWAKLTKFPEKEILRQHVSGTLYQLADLIVGMRYNHRTNPGGESLNQLVTILHRLEPYGEDHPGETYRNAYNQFFDNEVGEAFNVAKVAIAAHGADSPEANKALDDYFEASKKAHYDKRDRARAVSRRYALWNDLRDLSNEIAMGIDSSIRPDRALNKISAFEKLYDVDLSDQVKTTVGQRATETAYSIFFAKNAIRQNTEQINLLEAQLERLAKAGGFSAKVKLDEAFNQEFQDPRTRARYEYIQVKRNPNASKFDLAKKRRTLYALDQAQMHWANNWAANHVDRIDVQIELDRLEHERSTPEIEDKIKQLKAKDTELRGGWGDPLIVSNAPESAKMVVAKLPDGTLKHLEWNISNHRWEARFEIPSTAQEGRCKVEIVAILADETRTVETFTYVVDNTAPSGKIKLTADKDRLRISVECSEDVARVEATLPNGQLVKLDKVSSGLFAATTSMPLERPLKIKAVLITCLLDSSG